MVPTDRDSKRVNVARRYMFSGLLSLRNMRATRVPIAAMENTIIMTRPATSASRMGPTSMQRAATAVVSSNCAARIPYTFWMKPTRTESIEVATVVPYWKSASMSDTASLRPPVPLFPKPNSEYPDVDAIILLLKRRCAHHVQRRSPTNPLFENGFHALGARVSVLSSSPPSSLPSGIRETSLVYERPQGFWGISPSSGDADRATLDGRGYHSRWG
mmetsp:Transcript_822/g.1767  ORF Transcript_822/g.1767 Transcript_822/m.1767 type:complete len:216 (+) Transcript_822:497-1144(+)